MPKNSPDAVLNSTVQIYKDYNNGDYIRLKIKEGKEIYEAKVFRLCEIKEGEFKSAQEAVEFIKYN